MIAEGPLDAIRLGPKAVAVHAPNVPDFMKIDVGDFVTFEPGDSMRAVGKVLAIVDSPIGARPLLRVEWNGNPDWVSLVHHSLVTKLDLIAAVGRLESCA